jgi:hypothetical protein
MVDAKKVRAYTCCMKIHFHKNYIIRRRQENNRENQKKKERTKEEKAKKNPKREENRDRYVNNNNIIVGARVGMDKYIVLFFFLLNTIPFAPSQTCGDFSTGTFYDVTIADDFVGKLGREHNRTPHTHWIVLTSMGLEKKERNALFRARDKPNAKDVTPRIIVPSTATRTTATLPKL